MSVEPPTRSQGDLWALGVVEGLEMVGHPAALLADGGGVVAYNDKAKRWLGDALEKPRQSLRFTDHDSHARFAATLGAVCAGQADARPEVVVQNPLGKALTLRLATLPATIRHTFVEARVLVLVIVPANRMLIDANQELYGLTVGETRLVQELCAGRSLKDASIRLNISFETARSRLKAVFSKTGTRRQGELIALLSRQPTRDGL